MPLVGNQVFEPDCSVPNGVLEHSNLWLYKPTGETFLDYQSYISKVAFYRKLQWSCRFTRKSGLTFKQAQLCEQAMESLLKQVCCVTAIQRVLCKLSWNRYPIEIVPKFDHPACHSDGNLVRFDLNMAVVRATSIFAVLSLTLPSQRCLSLL